MGAVDFNAWAVPDLILPLRGRTYVVRPPSVEGAKQILAAAVLGEVNLGLVEGPVPAEVQAVLDGMEPDDHPALGSAYGELVADGVDPGTIDRMAVYAVFYWARGREYADRLATLIWAPLEGADPDAGDASRKG